MGIGAPLVVPLDKDQVAELERLAGEHGVDVVEAIRILVDQSCFGITEIDEASIETVETSADFRAVFAVPFSEAELTELGAFARREGTDEITAIHDLVMSALAAGRQQ